MGLAGSPHCVAMCGAACTGIASRCGGARPQRALLGLHLGRLLSYAAGGAVAAAGVGAIAGLAQWSPALRPLWTLVHAAALGLGVWLLWRGRQPAFLENIGRGTARGLAAAGQGGAGELAVVHGPRLGTDSPTAGLAGPSKAALAGAMWLAWPCGLLHSALVMAALANGALGGAGVMAAFAIGTSVGLWLGPALWWRLGTPGAGWLAGGGAVRLAGAGLAAASAWALFHDLGVKVLAYCFG